MIRGALLAYPQQFTITHVITQMHETPASPGGNQRLKAQEDISVRCPGNVVEGRISPELLDDLVLSRLGWKVEDHMMSSHGYDTGYRALKKLVLCGPQSFEGAMYEMLSECYFFFFFFFFLLLFFSCL
jgi:hypothetical protein